MKALHENVEDSSLYKNYSEDCPIWIKGIGCNCIKTTVRDPMLKKIMIRNVHSIDSCEIDFDKGNYKFADSNIYEDVVNPIVIYGHNGSGKSSVMKAIAELISMMIAPADSLMPFSVNDFRFQEYRKDPVGKKDLVKGAVALSFTVEKDQYEYYLETSRHPGEGIAHEYLKKNGELYFDRIGSSYIYKGKRESIDKAISIYAPLLRLLASSEIGDVGIQMAYTHICSYVHVNLSLASKGGFVTSRLFANANTFDLLVSKSSEVMEALREYGTFPVYSVHKNQVISPEGLPNTQYSIRFEEEGFKGALPVQLISTGMYNQSVLLSLLFSMPKGSVLFVDEADIALHPTTLKAFLKVIRERRIQVVLALHNTFAMQELRPDQVYFAKWDKGFSTYHRLSRIYPNIREVNNMEKMYLSSLFDEAMGDSGNEHPFDS